jgi:hypothetical protein
MPPAPGSSGDLPPGYLTGDAKAARRKSARRKGRLMMVLGVLVVLVAAGATAALTAQSNKDQTLADISVGDCFTGEANDLEVVDCDDPHQFELYDLIPATNPDADYPGAEAAQADAEATCTGALVAYYGAAIEVVVENGLNATAFAPTEEQWNAGETDTYCVALGTDGDVIQGSIEGDGAG